MIGIVAEFNPFHAGHEHLIRTAKNAANGADAVCVMSGSMVQRGDVAIFDKWQRAKEALCGGADLVAELPTSVVLQSADNFALGAVRILQLLGADTLAFGCECENIEILKEIARIKNAEPEKYKKTLKDALKSGMGYPASCEAALKHCLGNLPSEAFGPNSTLAAAYIASSEKFGAKMKFLPVKRIGNYHSTEKDVEFPSATAIREAILSKENHPLSEKYKNIKIYDIEKISPLILGFFRLTSEDKLSKACGMEPGLAAMMKKAAAKSSSVKEFTENCVSKRFTAHRIRRAMLCSLLEIESFTLPDYVRVLAFNKNGAKILKSAKECEKCTVVTKTANYDFSQTGMFSKDILSTDIAALCTGENSGRDYTTSPVVADKQITKKV